MAKYTGNLTDFLRYVGPLTRNIVSNLSRKYKKHTTCYHKDCGKWKLLEAAHIKGFERPTIIANILEEYKQGDDYYEIDLNEFKEKFILAHTPIENVILPMCKKHHLEYDNENKINQEYPVIINEFIDEEDNTDYSVEELIELEEKEIKAVVKEISIQENNKVFIFKILGKLKAINFDFIETFIDSELCKELFGMKYPILLDISNLTKSEIKNKITLSGKERYYSYNKNDNKFFFQGKEYLVSNDWYPNNRGFLVEWLTGNELE